MKFFFLYNINFKFIFVNIILCHQKSDRERTLILNYGIVKLFKFKIFKHYILKSNCHNYKLHCYITLIFGCDNLNFFYKRFSSKF